MSISYRATFNISPDPKYVTRLTAGDLGSYKDNSGIRLFHEQLNLAIARATRGRICSEHAKILERPEIPLYSVLLFLGTSYPRIGMAVKSTIDGDYVVYWIEAKEQIFLYTLIEPDNKKVRYGESFSTLWRLLVDNSRSNLCSSLIILNGDAVELVKVPQISVFVHQTLQATSPTSTTYIGADWKTKVYQSLCAPFSEGLSHQEVLRALADGTHTSYLKYSLSPSSFIDEEFRAAFGR